MIKFYVKPFKKPGTETILYMAAKAPGNVVDLKTICERIEKRSTMSSADIRGVIDAMTYEIKQELLNGNNVRLGETFGSFSLTLRCNSVSNKDAVTADTINAIKVNFTPNADWRFEFKPGSPRVNFEQTERND